MALEIIPIKTSDNRYDYVERLLEEAFPIDERRDAPQQRAYTDGNPLFTCCLIANDNAPAGLITYWVFADFAYVEHFAIDPALRGRGIGSDVIKALSEITGKPIVLEVEMPTDSISRRRIDFYKRSGLRLWEDVKYIQPAYRAGGNSLEMKLMATYGLAPETSNAVISTIHKNVYDII